MTEKLIPGASEEDQSRLAKAKKLNEKRPLGPLSPTRLGEILGKLIPGAEKRRAILEGKKRSTSNDPIPFVDEEN